MTCHWFLTVVLVKGRLLMFSEGDIEMLFLTNELVEEAVINILSARDASELRNQPMGVKGGNIGVISS